MMSRWLALIRTSSSNGKSHSKRTIRVCTSLKTLVTLSSPIIQPMSWSCTASCNGRVLVRLSILSTDVATLPWSQTLQFQTGSSGFSNKIHIQLLPDKLSESSLSKHLTCVSRTYSQPQPVNQINLHTSLCLSPDKLSESSLSKHLTCVSRTYSQPQPVEIFSNITTRRRMARERRGAGSSLVSMEMQF